MVNLQQSLRRTLRARSGNSGFTAVAVVSLALGIGANTVLFFVLDAPLVRGLPVRQPESSGAPPGRSSKR
jgi:putative ABC transport system permease protein